MHTHTRETTEAKIKSKKKKKRKWKAKRERNTVCATVSQRLCEDVWNTLPHENWLRSKQQAYTNGRGRVKNKVMKKCEWVCVCVCRKHEILVVPISFFFSSSSPVCTSACNILTYWWLRGLQNGNIFTACVSAVHANWRTVFAFSRWLHAWFISTVYGLHERCTKYRCLYGTYVPMHARMEHGCFFSSLPLLLLLLLRSRFKLFKSNKWKWLENISLIFLKMCTEKVKFRCWCWFCARLVSSWAIYSNCLFVPYGLFTISRTHHTHSHKQWRSHTNKYIRYREIQFYSIQPPFCTHSFSSILFCSLVTCIQLNWASVGNCSAFCGLCSTLYIEFRFKLSTIK